MHNKLEGWMKISEKVTSIKYGVQCGSPNVTVLLINLFFLQMTVEDISFSAQAKL